MFVLQHFPSFTRSPIFSNFHLCPIFINFAQFLLEAYNFHHFLLESTSFHQISSNFYDFLPILPNVHQCLAIIINVHQFSSMFIVYEYGSLSLSLSHTHTIFINFHKCSLRFINNWISIKFVQFLLEAYNFHQSLLESTSLARATPGASTRVILSSLCISWLLIRQSGCWWGRRERVAGWENPEKVWRENSEQPQ